MPPFSGAREWRRTSQPEGEYNLLATCGRARPVLSFCRYSRCRILTLEGLRTGKITGNSGSPPSDAAAESCKKPAPATRSAREQWRREHRTSWRGGSPGRALRKSHARTVDLIVRIAMSDSMYACTIRCRMPSEIGRLRSEAPRGRIGTTCHLRLGTPRVVCGPPMRAAAFLDSSILAPRRGTFLSPSSRASLGALRNR